MKAGVDIPNDGEFGKPMRAASDRGAWGNYIFDRVSGFVPTPPDAVAPDTAAPGAPMRIVGVRWEQREFAEFYADTGQERRALPRAARCAPGRSPISDMKPCAGISRT